MVKKVICELCSQEISASNYSKHLRRHQDHPETFNKKISYKLNHEGLTCQFCNKECKNRNSLCNHERLCKENPDKQQIQYKGPNIGHTAWNKDLTKETDDRVAKYSKSHKESYESGKIKKLTGELNPSKRQEVREKISQSCLEKSSKGEWHKSLAKDMHYQYKDMDLDGTWELKYAQYLDDTHIPYIRCTERFPYIFEGKIHYYTPDFYLLESQEYIQK